MVEYFGPAQNMNVAYCRKSLPIIVRCKVCRPYRKDNGGATISIRSQMVVMTDDTTQPPAYEQEMQHTFWGEYSRPRSISPRLKYKLKYYVY